MKSKVFLLAFLSFVFGSCAPSYMPNLTNAPLLYQKGDFMAGLHLSNSLELQSAFGLSDHVGVMGNIVALPLSENRYYYGEAGLGAYTVLNDKFHLELFAGGGLGYGKASGKQLFSQDRISEEGKYTKFFIQPDVGLHYKIFEIALGLRVGYVSYSEFRRNDTAISPEPFAWLIEPGLSLRFGFGGNGFFENKKLAIQLGFSSTLSGDANFENAGVTAGLGLVYRNRKYNTGFKTK